MNQYFILSVDVEESGLIEKDSGAGCKTNFIDEKYKRFYEAPNSIRAIPTLQKLLEKHGVRPCYFINYPIAASDSGTEVIRDIAGQGRCEVGAHMHSWCTPPFEEEWCCKNTFFNNLDSGLQEAKLASLVEKIHEGIGIRPKVYRSGKFGFSDRQAELLARHGILVDSSIYPYTHLYPEAGGPDFSMYTHKPFWLETRSGTKVLEVPLSVGFTGIAVPGILPFRHLLDKSSFLRKTRFRGVLSKLGLFERVQPNPEVEKIGSLKKHIMNYRDNDEIVFNLFFHSTSLYPGENPFVKDEAQRALFLKNLDELVGFIVGECGFTPTTFTELYATIAKGD